MASLQAVEHDAIIFCLRPPFERPAVLIFRRSPDDKTYREYYCQWYCIACSGCSACHRKGAVQNQKSVPAGWWCCAPAAPQISVYARLTLQPAQKPSRVKNLQQ